MDLFLCNWSGHIVVFVPIFRNVKFEVLTAALLKNSGILGCHNVSLGASFATFRSKVRERLTRRHNVIPSNIAIIPV